MEYRRFCVGRSGMGITEPAPVFLHFVVMAEMAVGGVGDQAFEGFGLHVDQGLIIATLKIQVAGFDQVVLDDDIQSIGYA
jgi:hypothetical protein